MEFFVGGALPSNLDGIVDGLVDAVAEALAHLCHTASIAVGIVLVNGIAAFATRRQDLDDDQLRRVTS